MIEWNFRSSEPKKGGKPGDVGHHLNNNGGSSIFEKSFEEEENEDKPGAVVSQKDASGLLKLKVMNSVSSQGDQES